MALRYITIQEVRDATGAPVKLVSNDTITTLGELIEKTTEKWLNTKFEPTLQIDVIDGVDKPSVFTWKNPVLSLKNLRIDEDDVNVKTLDVNESSGRISFTQSSNKSSFRTSGKIKIKYLYGLVDDNKDAQTETTSDIVAGSSVTIPVSTSSGFSKNDWIKIIGMDGNNELAKITDIADATNLIVKTLNLDHEEDSLIIKQEIPDYIRQYMIYETAINVAINAVGATYVFNASYSLGDLQVTKGVPYTHWRESTEKLIKQRNNIKTTIKIRPCIR